MPQLELLSDSQGIELEVRPVPLATLQSSAPAPNSGPSLPTLSAPSGSAASRPTASGRTVHYLPPLITPKFRQSQSGLFGTAHNTATAARTSVANETDDEDILRGVSKNRSAHPQASQPTSAPNMDTDDSNQEMSNLRIIDAALHNDDMSDGGVSIAPDNPQIKHPRSEAMVIKRASSFTTAWPFRPTGRGSRKHRHLLPDEMARAGWTHRPVSGSPDNVVCTLCNLELDGWEVTDDPVDEHKRRNPKCMFFVMPDPMPEVIDDDEDLEDNDVESSVQGDAQRGKNKPQQDDADLSSVQGRKKRTAATAAARAASATAAEEAKREAEAKAAKRRAATESSSTRQRKAMSKKTQNNHDDDEQDTDRESVQSFVIVPPSTTSKKHTAAADRPRAATGVRSQASSRAASRKNKTRRDEDDDRDEDAESVSSQMVVQIPVVPGTTSPRSNKTKPMLAATAKKAAGVKRKVREIITDVHSDIEIGTNEEPVRANIEVTAISSDEDDELENRSRNRVDPVLKKSAATNQATLIRNRRGRTAIENDTDEDTIASEKAFAAAGQKKSKQQRTETVRRDQAVDDEEEEAESVVDVDDRSAPHEEEEAESDLERAAGKVSSRAPKAAARQRGRAQTRDDAPSVSSLSPSSTVLDEDMVPMTAARNRRRAAAATRGADLVVPQARRGSPEHRPVVAVPSPVKSRVAGRADDAQSQLDLSEDEEDEQQEDEDEPISDERRDQLLSLAKEYLDRPLYDFLNRMKDLTMELAEAAQREHADELDRMIEEEESKRHKLVAQKTDRKRTGVNKAAASKKTAGSIAICLSS